MSRKPYVVSLVSLLVVGAAVLGTAYESAPPSVSAQPTAGAAAAQGPSGPQSQLLLAVQQDPGGAAGAIVSRWESAAMAAGKWDDHYAEDMYAALVKLAPESLLAALQAQSYESVMHVLATGSSLDAPGLDGPQTLGSFSSDLVYTPIAPCRIVDTRSAVGAFAAGTTRAYDADGTTLTAQGGSSTGCGIPFGVATAAAMNVTIAGADGFGWATVWGLGAMPNASLVNYTAGWTIANSTIAPIAPGSGADFQVNLAGAGGHVIIDVMGYYSAPVATALSCTIVQSAVTAVPVNAWTNVDASCPAGMTATGGGTLPQEGTLGWPGVWTTSIPIVGGWRTWANNQTGGARNLQTFANCCRVPGR